MAGYGFPKDLHPSPLLQLDAGVDKDVAVRGCVEVCFTVVGMTTGTDGSKPAKSIVRVLSEITSLGGTPLKFWLLAMLVVVASSGAMQAISPLWLRALVDGFGSGTSKGAIPHIVLYVGFLGGGRLAYGIGLFVFGRVLTTVKSRLANQIYKHMMDLPLQFHINKSTGELDRTIADGLNGIRILLTGVIFGVLPVLVQVGMMFLVVSAIPGRMSILVAAILAAFVGTYGIVFAIGTVNQGRAHRCAVQRDAEASGIVTDALLNFEPVKLFGASSVVMRRTQEKLEESAASWQRLFGIDALTNMVGAILFVLAFGSLTYLISLDVEAGTATVGDFLMVSAYILQLLLPIEAFGLAVRDLTQGITLIRRLSNLLEATRERDDGVAAPGSAGALHVSLKEIHFDYGDGRPVLRGVNIDIQPGKRVAVVGTSGSGKSTLARIITGLYAPTRGVVSINGKDLQELSLESVRSRISVVPQDATLLNDSLRANILLGDQSANEDEILQAASSAGLDETLLKFFSGIDVVVGERGLAVSGGERQRIALARAVLKKPGLFIFDEATSSLDNATERDLKMRLGELSAGVTTLIIAHRLTTVVDADEIVVLDEGRVVECGSHAELLERDGVYASLWFSSAGIPQSAPAVI